MIQEKLAKCAEIIRKFDLGKEDYFHSLFPGLPDYILVKTWRNGFGEVRHKDIIKNSSYLNQKDLAEVENKINSVENSKEVIYGYLYSEFDIRGLKLRPENIERRVRTELAKIYLNHLITEIEYIESKITNQEREEREQILKKIEAEKNRTNLLKRLRSKAKTSLIVFSVGLVLFSPKIIEGLTPLDKLTNKIYEDSSYKVRVGAVCRDGRNSSATGRGACSHHGGVRKWKYKKKYRKTYMESKAEARNKSWID